MFRLFKSQFSRDLCPSKQTLMTLIHGTRAKSTQAVTARDEPKLKSITDVTPWLF